MWCEFTNVFCGVDTNMSIHTHTHTYLPIIFKSCSISWWPNSSIKQEIIAKLILLLIKMRKAFFHCFNGKDFYTCLTRIKFGLPHRLYQTNGLTICLMLLIRLTFFSRLFLLLLLLALLWSLLFSCFGWGLLFAGRFLLIEDFCATNWFKSYR